MILAVAIAAWRECMRRAFPYVCVAALVTLSIVSQLLHLFTFGAGAQEATNLALSAVLVACLANAAFVGTALVRTDLERGTLALLLSQPVGLGSYVLGRFLGLAAATVAVGALAAGGVAATLLLAGSPEGTFSAPLLLGWARAGLAALVLAAASLAVSAAMSRFFAPVVLLALFVAGDIAPSGPLSRALPAFGLFGLEAGRSPPMPWLALYAALYSLVFLAATYLQLALRAPIRTES